MIILDQEAVLNSADSVTEKATNYSTEICTVSQGYQIFTAFQYIISWWRLQEIYRSFLSILDFSFKPWQFFQFSTCRICQFLALSTFSKWRSTGVRRHEPPDNERHLFIGKSIFIQWKFHSLVRYFIISHISASISFK